MGVSAGSVRNELVPQMLGSAISLLRFFFSFFFFRFLFSDNTVHMRGYKSYGNVLNTETNSRVRPSLHASLNLGTAMRRRKIAICGL